MHKINCYNCKRVTQVSAPAYRCEHCNYPLKKFIDGKPDVLDEELIKDIHKKVDKIEDKVKNGLQQVELIIEGNLPAEEKKQAPEKKETSAPKPLPKATAPPEKSREELLQKLETLIGSPKPSVLEKIQQDKTPPSTPSTPKVLQVEAKIKEKPIEKPVEKEKEEVPKPTDVPVIQHETNTTNKIILKLNQNPDKKGKIVAGWLVVHTENKASHSFELFEGTNIIGRSDKNRPADISIEKDKYISRVHCGIEVRKDFLHRFVYILKDDGEVSGKPSTNGCFVNGIDERLPKEQVVYLRDGDIIQVGETKLVFKDTYKSENLNDAATSVINMDYIKTIQMQ
ncbi:MAG: FHA domain-containing protein [Chitinophagales bacterium]|nr:FHA domain-containing protein [Bacteroidota bacterium]MCB9044474.1 FHA domain-containing protein [Chitinophagales bacterium]